MKGAKVRSPRSLGPGVDDRSWLPVSGSQEGEAAFRVAFLLLLFTSPDVREWRACKLVSKQRVEHAYALQTLAPCCLISFSAHVYVHAQLLMCM